MTNESTMDRPIKLSQAVETFAQMFELLEDYAPTWYSEELHHRAEAALQYFRSLKEN